MSKIVEEKPDVSVEHEENTALSSTKYDALPEIGSPERLNAERKLVRKLDTRLLPTIFFIFIMNYIDRNGITTARLQGFQQDLGLSDLQYSVVLSVLFASYSPAQIPSNMILNYITRPSWYIGGCVMAWGLTSALTGVTKGYSGVLACRFFIGLPEAAFYPGAIYLLSRWYTKKELAFRSAILYSGLLTSNAFGALIAAGILGHMNGKRGIQGWRWLFFIEGAITITIGIFSIWALPDYVSTYPRNTNWIVGDQRRLAQARLAEDAGEADQDTEQDTPLAGLKMAAKDPLVWTFALSTTAQLLGLSFVSFFPTLTQTLGFSTTISLLLAAYVFPQFIIVCWSRPRPPWLLSGAICCLSAWHADKTGERFFHIAGWWWAVIVGYIIGLSTMSTGGRYFSLFLMSFGYVGFAMTLVWVSNAIPRPPAMGSYVWKAEWGPEYHQSMIISLCGLVLSSLLSLGIRQHLVRRNRQLDDDATQDALNEDRVKEAAILEGISFEQALEKRKGFRYLY
ncbi:major facilitator superfamily domain-containing protein [Mycena galopus ATCC 62051]|nr:major facilitator superfamily domain-containing protein [Mycena galopus ATCC 62051]